jgi:hypothetical protein
LLPFCPWLGTEMLLASAVTEVSTEPGEFPCLSPWSTKLSLLLRASIMGCHIRQNDINTILFFALLFSLFLLLFSLFLLLFSLFLLLFSLFLLLFS